MESTTDKRELPEESNNQNGSTTPVPEWLEKLQNESWQAELLISGGALVGLFSAYDVIDNFCNYLEYSSSIGFSTINTFRLASGLIIFILIIGFISHLVLRGFWIGLIGLNSVFPAGINASKLSFKGRFRNFFREEKNDSLIIRLDKVCGLIFAVTFVILFAFLGVILFLQIIPILEYLFPRPSEVKSTVIRFVIGAVFIIGLLAGALTFIDFLTGGRLKKIKWLVPVYYPIHWIVSIITFSFLYRRLYYTIVSNVRGYYLVLIFCVPVALVFMLSMFDDSDSGLSDARNRNAQFESETQTYFLSVKDEIVREDELEISILHLSRLESRAFKKWKELHNDNKTTSFNELTQKEKSEVLQNLYVVYIDSVQIRNSDEWLISTQRGGSSFVSMRWTKLIKVIDLSGFKNGNHKLSVKINLDADRDDSDVINKFGGYQATVNFILRRPFKSNDDDNDD